jgi:hypothetical protein
MQRATMIQRRKEALAIYDPRPHCYSTAPKCLIWWYHGGREATLSVNAQQEEEEEEEAKNTRTHGNAINS